CASVRLRVCASSIVVAVAQSVRALDCGAETCMGERGDTLPHRAQMLPVSLMVPHSMANNGKHGETSGAVDQRSLDACLSARRYRKQHGPREGVLGPEAMLQ